MSPHAYTEDQLVEQPAIGLFAELGWATVSALEETFGAGLNTKVKYMRMNDNTLLKDADFVFPKDNLWPIPISELDNNPLAKQNPGW